MDQSQKHMGSPLGDLRAEHDHEMLDKAFLETEDYRSLIESEDKTVVVGRRGTGKSSLSYRLGQHWTKTSKKLIVHLALEKDQVIGMEHVIGQVSGDYRQIGAACQIIWQYALIMETALEASVCYKLKSFFCSGQLAEHIKEWRQLGDSISTRFLRKIKQLLAKADSVAEIIGELSSHLQLKLLHRNLVEILEDKDYQAVLLIDKLDEGYTPSNSCIALVDGLVDASITLNTASEQIRPVLFIRDNIYRTIAKNNSDFSRSIEGQTLRLHWNDHQLLHLVANRVKVTFAIAKEATEDIWNSVVAGSLKGRKGFRSCLRYTLYRPRDILVLLNQAFYIARKDQRNTIIEEDVTGAAKQISQHRIDDLHKEYSAIIPGLQLLTTVFANGPTELLVSEAEDTINTILSQTYQPGSIQEELTILGEPREALRLLYSIGFLGILGSPSHAYAFCHDGRSSQKEITNDDRLLIHPCYWMALNLSTCLQDRSNPEDIHDEYDITVTEDTIKHRTKRLVGIAEALNNTDQVTLLHTAIMQALKVVFSRALLDMEAGSSRHKSDTLDTIVALNTGQTPTWERIREDYETRHVLFVLLDGFASADTYKHAAASIGSGNGRLVFLVSRDNEECKKHDDLSWIKDIFKSTGITVVKLPISLIERMLRKLRNPQKHDESEQMLDRLLNTYERHYLKNITPPKEVRIERTPESTLEIQRESTRCFGELRTSNTGEFFLDVYPTRTVGEGKQSRLGSTPLTSQPSTLLHYALENAAHRFTSDAVESARESGQYKGKSECEPPDAKTFYLSWTPEELQEKLIGKQKPKLSKNERGKINTAISRIRKLVHFSDDVELVELDKETWERRTTIPFRYCRRTAD